MEKKFNLFGILGIVILVAVSTMASVKYQRAPRVLPGQAAPALACLPASSGSEFRSPHVWNGFLIPGVDVTNSLDDPVLACFPEEVLAASQPYQGIPVTGALPVFPQYQYRSANAAASASSVFPQYQYRSASAAASRVFPQYQYRSPTLLPAPHRSSRNTNIVPPAQPPPGFSRNTSIVLPTLQPAPPGSSRNTNIVPPARPPPGFSHNINIVPPLLRPPRSSGNTSIVHLVPSQAWRRINCCTPGTKRPRRKSRDCPNSWTVPDFI